MSLIYMIVMSLLIGTLFGFALEKSRVFEPGAIVGQMQLKRFTMVKVFFTAIITGMVILSLMTLFGWIAITPESLPVYESLIGGLILGVGVSLSGACPGTSIVQAGVGYKDAYFTIIGGIVGGIIYGVYKAPLTSWLASPVPAFSTFYQRWNISYWLLSLMIALIVAIGLYFLEKWRSWKVDLGNDFDAI